MGFFVARFISFIAITMVFYGSSYEALFIYFALKIDLIILNVSTIAWSGKYVFYIIYIVEILCEFAFIIFYYNIIIRGVLWKYYKLFGSNSRLQYVYSVSAT